MSSALASQQRALRGARAPAGAPVRAAAAARRPQSAAAAAPQRRPQQQQRQQLGARQWQQRGGVLARAAAWGGSDDEGLPGDFVMAEADYGGDDMSAADIKAALLDSFYGTERGLAARSEVRAEVNELITQLEAKNPNPSPTEMLGALSGDWKLVYTSNSELLAILALAKLPFVTVGDITQHVDAASSTVENRVQISVPLSRTALSTTAAFEVRSPKRIAVRFERGGIATPELLSDIEVPETISVLGQTVDLTPLRGVLQPVGGALSGLLGVVSGALRQAPDLSFPLPAGGNASWLLTTYLDEDTRITRGDGGSVFVLTREVSVQSPSAVIEPAAAGEAPAGYV